MKYEEVRFLTIIATNGHLAPRDLLSLPDFQFPKERADYFLKKWHDKGWYTYVGSLDDGKLTSQGLKQARAVGILTKVDDGRVLPFANDAWCVYIRQNCLWLGSHVGRRMFPRRAIEGRKMKKYIEIGFGNTWFIRTEIEDDNGNETEHGGIGHLTKVDGVYLRVWVRQTVYIWSSNEGFKKMRKNRTTFKFLFGIAGA